MAFLKTPFGDVERLILYLLTPNSVCTKPPSGCCRRARRAFLSEAPVVSAEVSERHGVSTLLEY